MRNLGLLISAFAVLAASQFALGQAEVEEEGRVIRIGPDQAPNERAPDEILPETMLGGPRFHVRPVGPISDFMIGVAAEPVSDDLRAHVELPNEAGLIVRTVVADSAAEKAGVQELDILVTADGKPLKSMDQLVDAVDNHGKSETAVTLELSRKGELVTVSVTPVKREETLVPGSAPEAMWAMPDGREMQMQMRDLAPMFGMMRGQWFDMNFNMDKVPNGVSISVSKQDDKPIEITIKRGDETWTVVGDDEEALAKLPDDLRPIIEQMTAGESAEPIIRFSPSMPMDNQPGFDMPQPMGHDELQAEMKARLQEVERMMEQMREQMEQQE